MNAQRLLDVVKASENQHTDFFNMACMYDPRYEVGFSCGTAGCLIGNYNLMAGRHPRTYGNLDHEYFGITEREYDWLFNDGAYCWSRKNDPRVRELSEVTKEQALDRLRKFIYYKLHKQEMSYEEQRQLADLRCSSVSSVV